LVSQENFILLLFSGKDIRNRTREQARSQLEGFRKSIICDANDILTVDQIERFVQLCLQESECSSAKKGGDLDQFPAGRMQPAFERAVRSLVFGQLSRIIETDSGLHIILRTDPQVGTSFLSVPSRSASTPRAAPCPLPSWTASNYCATVALHEYEGTRKIRAFSLAAKPLYCIGRLGSAYADIEIQHPSVADTHVTLVHGQPNARIEGVATLTLLASAGTAVSKSLDGKNKKQIKQGSAVVLKNDMVLWLGSWPRCFLVTGLYNPPPNPTTPAIPTPIITTATAEIAPPPMPNNKVPTPTPRNQPASNAPSEPKQHVLQNKVAQFQPQNLMSFSPIGPHKPNEPEPYP
jgi:NIMA-interacting peptidyl-prolyl cis-trans isomerase 1